MSHPSIVFVAGSRQISRLPTEVRSRLDTMIEKGFQILVGDANGADKAVQRYLADNSYPNVLVHCMKDHCRNNVGNWPTREVAAPRGAKGFDYYSLKDRAMAEAAEYGLMLWDGKSKGTVNNVVNLSRDHKPVVVYVAPTKQFRTIKTFDDIKGLLAEGDSDSVERIVSELRLHVAQPMRVEPTFPAIQYAKASDDVNVAYFSVGGGRPIVFASNIFGDVHLYRRAWPHVHDITDRLAGLGWRVIRHDHRGMGYSDRDVSDLSLEARVSDVRAVVNRLDLKRFALAGVSLGAATAMAYAARNQAQISHLVLISPWVSGARLFDIPDLRVATSTPVTGEREWKVFANMLGSVATAFEDPELGRQIASAIQESTDPKGFAAYNETSRKMDLTELLPQIVMPCLVIHEPSFPFGSFELCRQVASGIPNAQFVIVGGKSIAGSMHEGHVTAIDQFLRSGTVTQSISVASGSPAGAPRFIAPDGLTPREVEVLKRVAAGMTNKAIAAELGVAVPTIERHLVNLYTKIGARGRADATAYAVRHGLDAPPL